MDIAYEKNNLDSKPEASRLEVFVYHVKRIARYLYTGYGVIVFTILFLIFFLLLLIPITFKSQFKLTGVFNRWWARLIYVFIGLPVSVKYKSKLDKTKQYIFCPNHFSYMDIV